MIYCDYCDRPIGDEQTIRYKDDVGETFIFDNEVCYDEFLSEQNQWENSFDREYYYNLTDIYPY